MSAEGVPEPNHAAGVNVRPVRIQVSSTLSAGLSADGGGRGQAVPEINGDDCPNTTDNRGLAPISDTTEAESDIEDKEKADLVPEPRLKSRTASLLDMAFLQNNENDDVLRRMSNQSDSTIPER